MCEQPAKASTATAASDERMKAWRFMAFLLLWFPMGNAIVAHSRAAEGTGDTPSGLVGLSARRVDLPGAGPHVRAGGFVDDGFGAGRPFLPDRFAECRFGDVAVMVLVAAGGRAA